MIQIDFKACLTSGQVFRFRRDWGDWIGVEGDHEYRFRNIDDVLSNPNASRLFRLDWDYSKVLPEQIGRAHV